MLIERNYPPWGGFLFGWFPNEGLQQEDTSCKKTPVLFNKWGLFFRRGPLAACRTFGTHSKRKPPRVG